MTKKKKCAQVVKSKNEGIPFTLQEMFLISVLAEKMDYLSHRIGLQKLIRNDFINNEQFVKLLNVKDEIDKIIKEIEKKYYAELSVVVKKLNKYKGQPIETVPKDLTKKYNIILGKIESEKNKKNKAFFKEFDELSESKESFYYKINDLARQAVIAFAEKENKKVKDLGLTKLGIDALINIYLKLEKK